MSYHKTVFLIGLSLLSSLSFAGEPCDDNFSATGSLLTSKTYKTTAVIANLQPNDVFDNTLQFTAKNGFTVLSSDKNLGVISAAQTSNLRNGKSVPLAILLSPDGVNTKISMNYSTPFGVISPEEAIKKHFCATVTAATNSPKTPIVANTTALVTRPALRGYSMIATEQKTMLQSELMKNVPDDAIGERVNLAKDAITTFLERVSCLTDAQGVDSLMAGTSALNEFAAPNINFASNAIMTRPMRGMNYHDKKLCVSVNRVHDWKSPANNALSFEVVFKADDSGEIQKRRFETIKQTDGTWLFSYFY